MNPRKCVDSTVPEIEREEKKVRVYVREKERGRKKIRKKNMMERFYLQTFIQPRAVVF